MTRRTRRIIFFLFLLAFIILAPLITLYAWGYSLDWEEKTIVATGGIYLKTHPSGAEIYINDKLRGKTNKFIRRLVPKLYEIKIIKDNYHSWQKNLLVEPRLVAKANNILLVPFNPKISLITKDDKIYEEIYSSLKNPDKEKTYFLSQNTLYDLNDSPPSVLASNVLNYTIYKNGILYLDYFTGKIYELDLTSLESVPFFEQVFPSFNQGKWILSNNGKKLLCQKDKSVEILWLEKIINNSVVREKGDIERIYFEQAINDVIWHPKTDNHLIVSTNNSILITELDNRPPRNTINFITTLSPQIQYNTKSEILYFLSQERLYQTEL